MLSLASGSPTPDVPPRRSRAGSAAAGIRFAPLPAATFRHTPSGRKLMADQQSRGGKKVGTGSEEDSQRQQQLGKADAPEDAHPQRPAEGQPGGPKPGQGKTRPQD